MPKAGHSSNSLAQEFFSPSDSDHRLDWKELPAMADSGGGYIPVATDPGATDQSNRTLPKYIQQSLSALLLGSRVNVLLVFIPATFFCALNGFPSPFIFTCSLLSLAPLAERLGFVTEQLALCTNPIIGGLLNATFSNAPELIIVLVALKNGYVRIIQLSLLGSILGNLLLCLGSAFLAGGVRHLSLPFNKGAAQMNCGEKDESHRQISGVGVYKRTSHGRV